MESACDKPPTVLANKVVKLLTDHLFGGKVEVGPQESLTIRTAFRSQGGSWELLTSGDIRQINLLSEIIVAWGKKQMSQRSSELGNEE